jgi:hypothetical protein
VFLIEIGEGFSEAANFEDRSQSRTMHISDPEPGDAVAMEIGVPSAHLD